MVSLYRRYLHLFQVFQARAAGNFPGGGHASDEGDEEVDANQTRQGNVSLAMSSLQSPTGIEDGPSSLQSPIEDERRKTLSITEDDPKVEAVLKGVPDELKQIGWGLSTMIARGGYGAIYKMSHGATADVAVLKVAIPDKNKRHKNKQSWVKSSSVLDAEADTFFGLQVVNSSHLCRLKLPIRGRVGVDIRMTNKTITRWPRWLMLDYFSDGDLDAWLTAKSPSQAEKAMAFWNAAMGLRDLGDNGFVHADVKARNILVDTKVSPDGKRKFRKAVMCDFGLSRKVTATSSVTGAGTTGWRSPEVVLCGSAGKQHKHDEKFCKEGKKDGSAVDVWSLASQIHVAFFERNPYTDLMEHDGVRDVKKARTSQKRKTFQNIQSHVLSKKIKYRGALLYLLEVLGKAFHMVPAQRLTIEAFEEALEQCVRIILQENRDSYLKRTFERQVQRRKEYLDTRGKTYRGSN